MILLKLTKKHPVKANSGYVRMNIPCFSGWIEKLSEKLPEAYINTSVEKVQDKLKDLNLDDDENIISLHLTSFFTNMAAANAITLATEEMYESDCVEPPPSWVNTFKTLLEMVSIDVLFLTWMEPSIERQLESQLDRRQLLRWLTIFWPNMMMNWDPIRRYVFAM